MPTDDAALEQIDSENEDQDSALPVYEILTYPADYTLELLVDKLSRGQIRIPPFQRQFVWTQIQGSRLIESFILGLPVPAVFLYQDPDDGNLLVVDGQQRLRTIAFFAEGFFGDEERGRRPVFRLKGLDESSPFHDMTYSELKDSDHATFNKLNDAVLRAFIIKQLNPNDSTSMYQVFERLNTGGTLLRPQEIRNCIYQGPFNDLLVRLNRESSWRSVFGRQDSDRRQRDIELVLRFFALVSPTVGYEEPMKEHLNTFMRSHRSPTDDELDAFRELFCTTIEAVNSNLGDRPFHIRAGLNVAVYDAVTTAFANNLDTIPSDIEARYSDLVSNPEFLQFVSSGTTQTASIVGRLGLASRVLFGN